jgi:hypothetical protein
VAEGADAELVAAAQELIAAAREVLASGVLDVPPARPCPHGVRRPEQTCALCNLIEAGAYG